MASSRRNQLAQLVMLKKIMKKCHGIAGAKKCIRRRGYLSLDSDNGENIIPSDVPKGHIPVYVGAGRRRFVIPATYLNDPLFRPLLEKAEEEFGFDHEMGLLIPCEEVTFQCLISLLDQRREAPRLLNSFF